MSKQEALNQARARYGPRAALRVDVQATTYRCRVGVVGEDGQFTAKGFGSTWERALLYADNAERERLRKDKESNGL